MRLGVLDIGSNTVHLLVADAHAGGRPQATTSHRSVLRLMRYLEPDGSISREGVSALTEAVRSAMVVARDERVEQLLAIATSAVREATNGAAVVAEIEEILGQPLEVVDGDLEARFTFVAVRRWLGWSAGRILMFDIGGGSLEIAGGAEEVPDFSMSLPLGAGRMTIEFLPEDPPGMEALERLDEHARAELHRALAEHGRPARPDRVIGTSKTIRSLAKLAGFPVGPDTDQRQLLPREQLEAWIPRLSRLPAQWRSELPGITPERTFQIVAGAVVVNAAMDVFRVDELEVCPWALREGVLLRTLERMEWAPGASGH
ncbi:MAG: Ppx/GppA phosphatase family protein [Agromyces sp.]